MCAKFQPKPITRYDIDGKPIEAWEAAWCPLTPTHATVTLDGTLVHIYCEKHALEAVTKPEYKGLIVVEYRPRYQ